MTTQNNKHKSCDFTGCFCVAEKDKTYCKGHQRLKDFQDAIKQQTGKKYDLSAIFATGLDIKNRDIVDTGYVEKQKETKQKVIEKMEDYIVFDKELNLVVKKCEYKKDIESSFFENHNRFKVVKRKLPDDWDVILVYHNGEFYKKMTVDKVVDTYKLQRGTVIWRLRVGGVERRKMHIKRQPLAELLTNEMKKIKAQIETEKKRIDTLIKKEIEVINEQDHSHLQKKHIPGTIRKHKRKVKEKYNQNYIDLLKQKKFEMLCFVECESEEYQVKLKTFIKSINRRIGDKRADNEK